LFLCSPLSLLNWRYCFSHGISAALLLHYHEIFSKTVVAFLPENFRKADTKVILFPFPAKFIFQSNHDSFRNRLCINKIFFMKRQKGNYELWIMNYELRIRNYIDRKQQNVNRVLSVFRSDFERAYTEQIPNLVYAWYILGTERVRTMCGNCLTVIML